MMASDAGVNDRGFQLVTPHAGGVAGPAGRTVSCQVGATGPRRHRRPDYPATEEHWLFISRLAEFEPCRPLDWRHRRALELVEHADGPRRCDRHDDAWIRADRAFLAAWMRAADARARAALARRSPDLDHATRLAGGADGPRAEVEARVLARQPVEEIAARRGLPFGAVAAYEALYFHVTDRLDSPDWIVTQVVAPALARQVAAGRRSDGLHLAPPMEGSMKLFGYFGGPFLVDLLADGFAGDHRVQAPGEVEAWFDERWRQTMRLRSAQAATLFDDGRLNPTELFALHARLIKQESAAHAARTTRSDRTDRSDLGQRVQLVLDGLPQTPAAGRDGARVEVPDDRCEQQPNPIPRTGPALTVPSGVTVSGDRDAQRGDLSRRATRGGGRSSRRTAPDGAGTAAASIPGPEGVHARSGSPGNPALLRDTSASTKDDAPAGTRADHRRRVGDDPCGELRSPRPGKLPRTKSRGRRTGGSVPSRRVTPAAEAEGLRSVCGVPVAGLRDGPEDVPDRARQPACVSGKLVEMRRMLASLRTLRTHCPTGPPAVE